MGGDAAKNPKRRLRDFPGGTVTVIADTALGIKRPPPIPVKARAAIKDSYPVQNAFTSEKMENTVHPIRVSCLWP